MPKIKIPKKSTNIDMTAMCDVAFLLLTFFMLATKFKPAEAVEIKTPNSVSSKIIPEKDVCIVSIDKEGKVYLQLDNPEYKKEVIESISSEKNLSLTKSDIKAFVNFPSVGVPFSKLPSLLKVEPSELASIKQNGIPTDSLNNELQVWIKYILEAYQGRKLNILVKGDNDANYKSFKNVIEAFKKNDQLKFQLITTPEDAPKGTALYATREKSK